MHKANNSLSHRSNVLGALVYVVGALVIAGCSSSSSTQTSWNACNALSPPQVEYTQTAGSGTPPTPAGGPITPGTYDLTAQTVYGASALAADHSPEQYVLTESTFQGSTLDFASDKGTFSTSGTTLTLSYDCLCKSSGCSVPTPASFGYTATPTQILFIEGHYVNGGTYVQTFTKR